MDDQVHIVWEGDFDELCAAYEDTNFLNTGMTYGSFSSQTYLEKEVEKDRWERCADPRSK